MAKTILKTDYSAKKCKEMEGHDGYVIRFDLCYKGKKVAEVYDDGNGGMVEIAWVYYDNKTESMKEYIKGASKDFDNLIKQMGQWESSFDKSLNDYDDEILVMEIYEDQRIIKQLKRLLKKRVLFINQNGKCQEIGPWKHCKGISQVLIDDAKKHFPEIKVTLNELDFSEALVEFKKAIS